MRQNLFGQWLADIAANFLAVILIVFIVLTQLPQNPPAQRAAVEYQFHLVSGIPAPTAVHALRTRLRDEDTPNWLDVSPRPLQVLPGKRSDPLVLFILNPMHYAQITRSLKAAGRSWSELTIPPALIGPSGDWATEFLALKDIARRGTLDDFATALRDLLLRHSAGARDADTARAAGLLGGHDTFSLMERFWLWGAWVRDLIVLGIITILGLMLCTIARRARR